MSEEEQRIKKARETCAVVGDALERLKDVPDPVARRRILVPCAQALRAAANELDQNGWLTE